ncbi:MAG: cytochrome P450 [Mesorhizobium sp.]|nr:cytochrome P450 [bacterium M00.F.Ca.ET.205.01.1.1]TGU48171.1 cytochrome P450 [bacterium M00.F.Ca.ET.152.01.1.1]TGV32409.1 cytochrome P450 [Mesorhizobium sp. M00.F.Ca.ET.186.01.1.1]TGZ39622.1 cytochrome P450 [bacterium M00.F.Ca.ET.162.01.1.1]TJW32506.1 MAG: cytochrome P450 [Mesorhizobium sp.]
MGLTEPWLTGVVVDNPAQIESVLNNIVYVLFAQSGQAGTNGKARDLGNLVVFDDPEAVDTIVKTPALFRKNFSLISALGFSRFNTNDEDWAIRRAITQDIYLAAAKPAQQPFVAEAYEASLSRSEATLPAIQQALFAASMTIFYRAFALVPDMATTLSLLDRVRDVLRRLQYYSWVSPTTAERATTIKDARTVIADFASMLMSDTRAAAEMKRFRTEATSIEGFSPVEEFVMNLFAGVETTVTTALWVMDRLGANQQVQERIHAEILSGEAQTPYTDCIINETMRYFPPIPFLTREVSADTVLDGRELRAGQLIMVSIVGVHQNPAFWENPRTFDASRKEFIDNSFDRRAFIPFLTGPRMCGGARLGRLEVKEAVLAIVRQFAFSRADDVIRFDYALALRPAQGSSVGVSRR